MADVQLHFFPLSFWSQVARVTLAEKGVAYEPKIVDITKSHAQCEPEYMRLNRKGVVPTLVHGGEVVNDAVRIIRFVNDKFEGPSLRGSDEVDAWIERVQALPIRDLTYGKRMLPNTDALVAARIARLEELATAHDDLAEAYRAKIDDQRGVQQLVGDEAKVAENTRVVDEFLDQLDAQLETNDFAAGSDYTLADAVVTPLLMRLTMLGFANRWEGGSIGRYLGRMRSRPSFAASFPKPPGS